MWSGSLSGNNSYEATHRVSGEKMRSASRVDLVFGSNSQLKSIAEVYASNDAKDKFVSDFVSAWNKVMNADRFDIQSNAIKNLGLLREPFFYSCSLKYADESASIETSSHPLLPYLFKTIFLISSFQSTFL